MKYGWIAVVAMMAALLSTGQVAAQDWGAEAAAESPPAEGSDAAQIAAERARRSVGEVGQSVRQESEDAIPLRFQFHGFYRARYNWVGNAPMPVGSQPGSASTYPSKNASYGYMRLRLDPEVTYGPNPDLPIAWHDAHATDSCVLSSA